MENELLNKLITENMKTVLGFSISRLQNMQEAEELASDIVCKLLVSGKMLRDTTKFHAFMWKVSESTYADFLRKKAKGRFEAIPENLADDSASVEQNVVAGEEIMLLRRELSLLSEQYRRCTVLYYMDNLTCQQIADRLSISMEMVKYYLFRARKIIREGMNMDRNYGEKSYNPVNFEIDFWGTKAGEDKEYRSFQDRKIRGNILLAAYYTPLSAQELSIELGVAMPYLEDELRLLEKRQYLVQKNGKYLTNIPIFTMECKAEINRKMKDAVLCAANQLQQAEDSEYIKHHGHRFVNDNLMRWQMIMLYSHFAMIRADGQYRKDHGELPLDGAYSMVNGGGGKGFVWGRCVTEHEVHDIEGIYNDAPVQDGNCTVIAFNFKQILHAQHVQTAMLEPIAFANIDDFSLLRSDCKAFLSEHGYTKDGKPNFAVYTDAEYEKLPTELFRGIEIFTELFRKTCEMAAEITAQHAPEHIRKYAQRVGAFVYQFDSLGKMVDELYRAQWLQTVDKADKPAMCLITHIQ